MSLKQGVITMDNYPKHPLYSEFMSMVINGDVRNNKVEFMKFLERKQQNPKEKTKLIAFNIRDFLSSSIIRYRVSATWYENDKKTFEVELKKVEAVQKEDGWHLVGWDENGKEYCIGGAVITAVTEIYRP
jgi:hypothetical protein